MDRRQAALRLGVLVTISLAACSTSTTVTVVGGTPSSSASPILDACSQLRQVDKLAKDADRGGYTQDELASRAIELRDWFWAQADTLTGQEAHKLRFMGNLLGEFADGTFPSAAWDGVPNAVGLNFSAFLDEDLQLFC